MDSEKKVVLIVICFVCFWLAFCTRYFRVNEVQWHFRDYADDYVEYIKETNEDADISYKDVNMIRDKMLPNFWSTVMNPFKWTEEQISSDDRLLRNCKAVWVVKERERNTEQTLAETTFNEREASWIKVEKKKEL